MINPRSVFVGRPIYNHATPGHDRGMLELCDRQDIGGQYDHCGCASIGSARDYIVHFFLTRTRFEWLVWIDADISFSRDDWGYLMEGPELAVCAEYLKKTQDLSKQVVHFGLGFARIHRSVFESIDNLVSEDGEPRLLRYRSQVELPGVPVTIEEFAQYHPEGVQLDGSRRNEDHGFWLLARLAGASIRIERRTKLGHTGPFTWWYDAAKLQEPVGASPPD